MELAEVSNSDTTQSLIFVSLLLSLFISLIVKYKLQKSSKNRYVWPPSPAGIPVIGNLHQLGSHPEKSLRNLFEKYGDSDSGLMLLRLGRVRTVVVSSPEAVREIATCHDGVFSGRSTSTASDAIYHGGNDIVFAQCDDFWRRARKLCINELLSPKRVRSFHPVRADEVSSLVAKLRQSSGEAVDLSSMLVTVSNDVISRCIFGRRYGGESEGKTAGIGEVVRRVMVQLMAFCVGDYFPALKWVDAVRGFVGELRSSVGDLDDFYSRVVEERASRGGGGVGEVKDFVDILLELQKDNEVGLEITSDHLKSILQDMFFGGIETTSTISEWFMAELMRKPEAMRKAQEEVRRVVGQKEKVEVSDLEKMDFFKCVMKETLRLHPPAPLLVPRKTTADVELSSGFRIPQGTRVLINAWAVQRHPGSWARSEEFVPERFEGSVIDYMGREHFQFIPFGFGKRRCPAIDFGMVGAEFVTANLLYWFDWKLPNGEEEKGLDMSEVYGIAVHKKIPLHLIPIPYSPS